MVLQKIYTEKMEFGVKANNDGIKQDRVGKKAEIKPKMNERFSRKKRRVHTPTHTQGRKNEEKVPN